VLAEELAVLVARAVAAAVLVAGEAALGAAVAPPQLRDWHWSRGPEVEMTTGNIEQNVAEKTRYTRYYEHDGMLRALSLIHI